MSDERTLVLIHAFPLGARMWEPQRHAFGSWRVETPTLPGFDDDETRADTMDAFAAHVHGALDRAGIDRAVIAGLSLGGYVALGMLRQRPERFSAVILADTRATSDSSQTRAARLKMLKTLEQHGPGGVFEEMRPQLFGATTHASRPYVIEGVRRLIESQSRSAIAGAIHAMLDRPDST